MKATDLLIAAGIFLIIILIVIPLSPMILDFFLIISISMSVMVLLMSLFTKETLDFSVFPSLLLILTLFRLALNISSTRLILGNNGEAGAVIKTFGNFVIGGNLIVGIIIFAIIIVIQFMVITKGAERVAEVAARFTLDAMPGKQMAIDADMNAGLIDELQAKERRSKIQREADFYGSMDGASKFVKGDAIVGILITMINMIGGIAIGFAVSGLPMVTVIQRYTLASVGDGLVSQIPALLISTATGIIVTRAASENNLGREITTQFTAQPVLLIVGALMVLALGMVPGLPKVPILFIAILLFGLGIILRRQSISKDEQSEAAAAVKEKKPDDDMESLLLVDPIELELGYGLITMVSGSGNGDLSERIMMIRRNNAMEQGFIIPSIRLHDNAMLRPNEYTVKIRGDEIARGEIMPDRFLAMHPEKDNHEIQGVPTTEPSFGLPALWITQDVRDLAELHGYTVIDPTSVLATHLSEILKRNSHELLDRQQVSVLLDNLNKVQPALVEEVFPKLFSLGDLQRILTRLLEERIPIRDIGTIVETMSDHSGLARNPEQLLEKVRQRLKRTITSMISQAGRVHVITLNPSLEQTIIEKVRQTEHGTFVALTPDQIHEVLVNLKTAIDEMQADGNEPLVLTSPAVRPHFKRMAEQLEPDLTVVSYNEIDHTVEIRAERMVSITI